MTMMPYPTLEQVNAADRVQVCRWYRFLPSPGAEAIARPGEYDAARAHAVEEAVAREVVIMNRIDTRLKELGGFTPEISKALGWNTSA